MTKKEAIINGLFALLGLIIVCIGATYLVWFIQWIEEMNLPKTFVNILLVALGSIIPSVAMGGFGMILFFRPFMDPWEERKQL